MDEDRALKARLLAEARRVREDRRAIRRDRRFEWAALLVLLGGLAFAAAYIGVAIGMWAHPYDTPAPFSRRFFVAAYRILEGRVSPDTGFTFVLTLLGVCTTINVGLIVAAAVSTRRAQVEYAESRNVPRTGAGLLAAAALVTAVLGWMSLSLPHAAGAPVQTSVAAVVTAMFATGIRNQLQAVDHSTRYGCAVDNLAALKSWRRELKRRNVPRLLDGVAIVSSRKSLRWRYRQGAAVRLLVLASMPVLYLTVLLIVHVGVDLIGSGSERIAWRPVLTGLGAVAVLAVIVGFAAGFFAVARYAQRYTTEHVRWRLDTQPRLIRLLWTAVAVVAIVVVLVHDGPWSALDMIGWLVAPIVTYLALRWSRTRPSMRWSRWAAAPVWGMVELALQDEHTRQEANRDRFFQEAKETAVA